MHTCLSNDIHTSHIKLPIGPPNFSRPTHSWWYRLRHFLHCSCGMVPMAWTHSMLHGSSLKTHSGRHPTIRYFVRAYFAYTFLFLPYFGVSQKTIKKTTTTTTIAPGIAFGTKIYGNREDLIMGLVNGGGNGNELEFPIPGPWWCDIILVWSSGRWWVIYRLARPNYERYLLWGFGCDFRRLLLNDFCVNRSFLARRRGLDGQEMERKNGFV